MHKLEVSKLRQRLKNFHKKLSSSWAAICDTSEETHSFPSPIIAGCECECKPILSALPRNREWKKSSSCSLFFREGEKERWLWVDGRFSAGAMRVVAVR